MVGHHLSKGLDVTKFSRARMSAHSSMLLQALSLCMLYIL